MSADNGIYILKTLSLGGNGFEYRVRHLSAIENLNVDETAPNPDSIQPSRDDYKDKSYHSVSEFIPDNPKHEAWRKAYEKAYNSTDQDVRIKNAREMFKNCVVFGEISAAYVEADRIYNEIMESAFPVLEYGISTILIPRFFY